MCSIRGAGQADRKNSGRSKVDEASLRHSRSYCWTWVYGGRAEQLLGKGTFFGRKSLFLPSTMARFAGQEAVQLEDECGANLAVIFTYLSRRSRRWARESAGEARKLKARRSLATGQSQIRRTVVGRRRRAGRLVMRPPGSAERRS